MFLIGVLFLGIQVAFLTVNIYLYIEDPKTNVAKFLDWFLDHGVKVPLCNENILLSPTAKTSPSKELSSLSSPFNTDSDDLFKSPIESSRSNNNRECIIRVSTISIFSNKCQNHKLKN